jgi:hypothetical protein
MTWFCPVPGARIAGMYDIAFTSSLRAVCVSLIAVVLFSSFHPGAAVV